MIDFCPFIMYSNFLYFLYAKVHKDTPLCKAVPMAYEQIGDLPDAGIGLEQCRLVSVIFSLKE